MGRSNCLIWALRKLARDGGYIAVGRSDHWRYLPRFLWSADLKEWWRFAPVSPKSGPISLLFCLWFRGRVVAETVLIRNVERRGEVKEENGELPHSFDH